MFERQRQLEREYRRSLAIAAIATVGLLPLVALVTSTPWWSFLDHTTQKKIQLGYQGPTRIFPELEALDPRSVQAFFYQRERTDPLPTANYEMAPKIALAPGPQPIARRTRRPQKQNPRVQPAPSSQTPEDVERTNAFHKPISLSEDFVILKLVKPVYPEYELDRGIAARVLVAVWVTPDGRIEMEQVQEATANPPYASTIGFELASLEAVRQWRVKPPKRHNKNNGIWITIPIEFEPEDEAIHTLDRKAVRSRY